MAFTADIVRIQYRRLLPNRQTTFVQRLVYREPGCVVTFMAQTLLEGPLSVDGRIVLENGSPVVWFTFPGEWHDLGRFHTADGTFTGMYANVLTPVERIGDLAWETTDLFLDVWLPADGGVRVLDRDELADAIAAGAIPIELAERAGSEADRLTNLARSGVWPPAVVHEWTLDRVLARIAIEGDTSV